MEKEKVSPVAIVLTYLLHFGLYYLAVTDFPHHHPHTAPYNTIPITVQLSTQFHPREDSLPNLDDLTVQTKALIAKEDKELPTDKNRYYLPQELSQQVRVLVDDTASMNIPINSIVKMTLYINEGGGVDDVTVDDRGSLTDEEEDQLKKGFRQIVFLAGMRGEKVVKSIYRVQLDINRRIIFHRD